MWYRAFFLIVSGILGTMVITHNRVSDTTVLQDLILFVVMAVFVLIFYILGECLDEDVKRRYP